MIETSASSPSVVLVAFNPGWADVFSIEAKRLHDLTQSMDAFVDHVGSTAVAGLQAKPFIDILITLPDWSQASRLSLALTALGYDLIEQIDGPDPRYFFRRPLGAGLPGFMLHLTSRQSAYGADMRSFRDLLRIDSKVCRAYEDVKRRLALDHADSLADYTRGKGDFVLQALLRWKGAYGVDRMLTHQSAELGRSAWLQIGVIVTQILIAFFAAWSVLTNDSDALALFAVIAVGLVFFWVTLSSKQKKHRSAGDQARRAVLVRSGLGELLSVPQQRSMVEQFSIDIESRSESRIEDYFSSRRAPGVRRLADMLTESAYWTRALQRGSAILFGTIFVAGILIFVGVMWRATVVLDHEHTLTTLRISIAFLVLLLSSEIAGTFAGHVGAVRTLDIILHRLEAAEIADYPEPDVLLLMADYNAVVEASPITMPGVYQLIGRKLSRDWHKYAAAHIFKIEQDGLTTSYE